MWIKFLWTGRNKKSLKSLNYKLFLVWAYSNQGLFKCSQRTAVGTWYMSSCMGSRELLLNPFWPSGGTVLYKLAIWVQKMTRAHSQAEYGTNHDIEIFDSFRLLKKNIQNFYSSCLLNFWVFFRNFKYLGIFDRQSFPRSWVAGRCIVVSQRFWPSTGFGRYR